MLAGKSRGMKCTRVSTVATVTSKYCIVRFIGVRSGHISAQFVQAGTTHDSMP